MCIQQPLQDEESFVLSNEQLGKNLFLIRLKSPLIAASVQPGQFVHTKIPGMEGHILRRPFSIYNADANAGIIEILYQNVGFGSNRFTELTAGETVMNIGPIGRGWSIPDGCKRALLVCGGVGAAPLFMHAKALVQAGVEVDVVLGAQTADAMVAHARYTEVLGHDPVIATDDGSMGFSGFCTVPAKDLIDSNSYDYLACCGPQVLMKIVYGMAAEAGIPCQVSMERRMACGVGACLSCVIDTTSGKQRCCVDGPVFEGNEVIW